MCLCPSSHNAMYDVFAAFEIAWAEKWAEANAMANDIASWHPDGDVWFSVWLAAQDQMKAIALARLISRGTLND